MQKKIHLSFRFSEFSIDLEHKHIIDIGKFAIFCLRAFRDGFSINNISRITNINESVIEKQLLFLQEQKYLSEDYKILDNAKRVLEIFDFLNVVANDRMKIHLEHYIYNKENKEFFTLGSSSKDISIEAKGTIINPIIGLYKISSILDELKTSKKYLNLLIKLFPKYESLINENLDGFVFNIAPTNNSFYLNKLLELNQITDLQHDNSSTIKIALPFTKYETYLKEDDMFSETENNWYNENKTKLNGSICSLTGNIIKNITNSEIDDPKLTIIPKLDIKNSILDKKIDVPLSLILDEKLRINKHESYQLKSLNDNNINSFIKS